MGLPVVASDTTWADAFSLVVAALFLVVAAPVSRGRVNFTSDNVEVICLLQHSAPTTDLFLFNCRKLVTDILWGCSIAAHWVP